VSLSDSEERKSSAGEPPLEVGPPDASEWARAIRESSINAISKQISKPLFGDALALISAPFYAFYVTLLKVRIKNEERIDMQLFFGFVGLFNILLCWPIGLILHWTRIEPFELPTKAAQWYTIICNVSLMIYNGTSCDIQ
jgi:drug/metabolite transporter (DMT)-like permease